MIKPIGKIIAGVLATLALFLSYGGTCQTLEDSFLSLYQDYEAYCMELVPDTISITGTVAKKAVPVEEDGKIVSYVMVSCGDTVWSEPNCKKYLKDDEPWWGNHLIADTMFFLRTTAKCDDVSKKHVCFVKRERPSWEGFIQWLKKNNLITSN